MTPRIFFINLMMGVLLVIMGVKIHDAWNRDETVSPSSGNVNRDLETRISTGTWNFPPESAYDSIIENNLFSNDRREFIPKEVSAPIMENNLRGKKITLYAVILEKVKRSALIGNPVSGKGVSPYIWVTEGQKVGDLKIAGIEKEYILIRNNGQTYQISLHEKERSKSNPRTVDNHEEASTSDKNARIIVSGSGGGESSSKPVKERKKDAANDGFTTISTPFGDMKVREK